MSVFDDGEAVGSVPGVVALPPVLGAPPVELAALAENSTFMAAPRTSATFCCKIAWFDGEIDSGVDTSLMETTLPLTSMEALALTSFPAGTSTG